MEISHHCLCNEESISGNAVYVLAVPVHCEMCTLPCCFTFNCDFNGCTVVLQVL